MSYVVQLLTQFPDAEFPAELDDRALEQIKSAWVEYLGEHPEPAIDRVQ